MTYHNPFPTTYDRRPNRSPVLSMDPGSSNMGIAVTEYSYDHQSARVLCNAIMKSPVKGIAKDLRKSRDRFLEELHLWIDLYKPDAMIIERYMSRGIRGSTGEEINIMIGAAITEFKDIPTLLVSAATWKNDFRRQFPNDQDNLKRLYKVCKTTPHQLDAVLQGLYLLKKGLDLDTIRYSIPSLLDQVESTSLNKLITRKTKY